MKFRHFIGSRYQHAWDLYVAIGSKSNNNTSRLLFLHGNTYPMVSIVIQTKYNRRWQ